MKTHEELKKIQTMRAELEEESCLLIEKQKTLEKSVLALEEKGVSLELKKEKAIVEDLRSKNEVIKNAIAKLEAEKKELEIKLEELDSDDLPEQPEETKEVLEDGITMTVVESEELVETQEKQQEEKRFKIF